MNHSNKIGICVPKVVLVFVFFINTSLHFVLNFILLWQNFCCGSGWSKQRPSRWTGEESLH